MKLLFTILGLISSILAVILSILPLEKIALIPAIAAFVFGLIAMYLSKDESKKLIKFTFLVTIISLAIITYKSVFSDNTKITTDENFIEKNQQSEEKAIEELEELEELNNFDDSDSIN